MTHSIIGKLNELDNKDKDLILKIPQPALKEYIDTHGGDDKSYVLTHILRLLPDDTSKNWLKSLDVEWLIRIYRGDPKINLGDFLYIANALPEDTSKKFQEEIFKFRNPRLLSSFINIMKSVQELNIQNKQINLNNLFGFSLANHAKNSRTIFFEYNQTDREVKMLENAIQYLKRPTNSNLLKDISQDMKEFSLGDSEISNCAMTKKLKFM